MHKHHRLAVLIILFIVTASSTTACTYDLTLKSTFTYTLPTPQQQDDQRQQQHREDAARYASRL